MGRHYCWWLIGLGLATIANSAAPQLEPSSLRAEIARLGAKAVVDRLYASHAYENLVMRRIRAGAVQWVLLAPALSDGTDAATAEELGEALVYALPKAPRAVLSVIHPGGRSVPRAIDTVCGASFYEGDPTDSKRYLRLAIQAVQSVNDSALRTVRDGCLAQLREEY